MKVVQLQQSTWGDRVIARRRLLKFTQGQLIEACAEIDPSITVTQQTISKIENNEIRPRDEIRDLVSLAMGTTSAELFPPDEYRFSGKDSAVVQPRRGRARR